jgi:hypothetical protein
MKTKNREMQPNTPSIVCYISLTVQDDFQLYHDK